MINYASSLFAAVLTVAVAWGVLWLFGNRGEELREMTCVVLIGVVLMHLFNRDSWLEGK